MEAIEVSSGNFKKAVDKAVKFIKEGKVLVCPTDTIYGLLADARNEKAVNKIFKIKRRKKTKIIPVFVKDIKMAKKLAFVNEQQEKFLKKVWPGKITAVLKEKNCCLPEYSFNKKKKTIALRIPKNKIVQELLFKLNRPLAETSVNISGRPAFTKIKEILIHFKSKKIRPDLILDAGDLPESSASTIIDLTGKKMRILRKGPVKL